MFACTLNTSVFRHFIRKTGVPPQRRRRSADRFARRRPAGRFARRKARRPIRKGESLQKEDHVDLSVKFPRDLKLILKACFIRNEHISTPLPTPAYGSCAQPTTRHTKKPTSIVRHFNKTPFWENNSTENSYVNITHGPGCTTCKKNLMFH